MKVREGEREKSIEAYEKVYYPPVGKSERMPWIFFDETMSKHFPIGTDKKMLPIKKILTCLCGAVGEEFSIFFRDVDMKFKWIFLFIIQYFFHCLMGIILLSPFAKLFLYFLQNIHEWIFY